MTHAKHAHARRAPGKHAAPRPPRRLFARTHLLFAAVVAAALASTLVGGGSAYAYFSSNGTGTKTASTTSLLTVTIAAFAGGDAPTATLVPGGTADVILRVNNPNSYSVPAYSITGNGTITADSGHTLCTTTGVTFTAPATPTGITLAAGTSLVRLPGAATMSNASSSGCQGATFHIPVTLTVRT